MVLLDYVWDISANMERVLLTVPKAPRNKRGLVKLCLSMWLPMSAPV